MCENSTVGSDSESSSRGESNDHIGNTKRYESFLSICENVLIMLTISINKRRKKNVTKFKTSVSLSSSENRSRYYG